MIHFCWPAEWDLWSDSFVTQATQENDSLLQKHSKTVGWKFFLGLKEYQGIHEKSCTIVYRQSDYCLKRKDYKFEI